MPDRDYYQILGVARDATPDQIKKAYRGQARKYHPDVNPGDKKAEARFKEAQAAYDVLSDPEKRSLYDRYGKAAFEGMGAAGPRSGATQWTAAHGGPGAEVFDFSQFFGPGFSTETGHAGGGGAGASTDAEGMGGGILDELLGRIRGGRGGASGPRRSSGPRRGRSLEAEISIPFLAAVQGGETQLQVERSTGQRESLVVKIPPGTQPGTRLRLRGQGEAAEAGGPRGDLTITVHVEPHPYFTMEGRDLYVDVPVTIAEAVLGAKIDVPTLDGLKTLTIPPGTSSGQKLRLRGQGAPAAGSKPAGDLFVVLKIVVPKTVDDQSRELIRQFAERNPAQPRQGLW